MLAADIGVLRDETDLRAAIVDLLLTSGLAFAARRRRRVRGPEPAHLGTQIAKSALLREESRGVHLREDFPARDDEHWRRHITLRLPAAQREGKA